MFCPKCGKETPDGSTFCGRCGADLSYSNQLLGGRGTPGYRGAAPQQTPYNNPGAPMGGNANRAFSSRGASSQQFPIPIIIATILAGGAIIFALCPWFELSIVRASVWDIPRLPGSTSSFAASVYFPLWILFFAWLAGLIGTVVGFVLALTSGGRKTTVALIGTGILAGSAIYWLVLSLANGYPFTFFTILCAACAIASFVFCFLIRSNTVTY